MDNLLDTIVDKFGLNIESAVKSRSRYIIETSGGSFTAKKNTASKEHIMFQHNVKEYLSENGFCSTDRFLLSCSGLPYISRGEDIYTVSRHYHCREFDFAYAADAEKASETLGILHSLTEKYDFSRADTVFMSDILAEYKKGITFLQSIKKTLTTGKGLSDFDVAVARNYEHYLKRAKDAVLLFQGMGYAELSSKRIAVCHNLVKEESFLINDHKEAFIIEFSKISAAYPVFDIGRLLRRIIKSAAKNGGADTISVDQLIRGYMKFGNLSEQDIKLLYAILMYPNSFVKACMSYYNKKRTFVPVSVKNKLDSIMKNKEAEERYIEQILTL